MASTYLVAEKLNVNKVIGLAEPGFLHHLQRSEHMLVQSSLSSTSQC